MVNVIAPESLASAWDVLVLFLVPIGGGIPAGVVLAQKRGLVWPVMAALYFVSDVILACVFEPIMLYVLRRLKRGEGNPRVAHVKASFRQSIRLITDRYGIHPSPFALIMITFGTDPMTGRSVAKLAGHGFLTGWALTIAGDMLFFLVVMASTLWLNNILGDGTWTMILVTIAVIGLPALIRRWREGPPRRPPEPGHKANG